MFTETPLSNLPASAERCILSAIEDKLSDDFPKVIGINITYKRLDAYELIFIPEDDDSFIECCICSKDLTAQLLYKMCNMTLQSCPLAKASAQ